MKYSIEATRDGYKMTAHFGSDPVSGISLERAGGHDELEELYAQAEEAWGAVRTQYGREFFDRLKPTTDD